MEEAASKHEVLFKFDGQGVGESQPLGPGGEQQHEVEAQSQPDEGQCSLLVPLPATNGHRHFDGLYDKPLLCCGCGIGWFCFVLGFAFPLLWYIATALYIGKFYLRDPRERAGLAASAIAALICSVAALITLLTVVF